MNNLKELYFTTKTLNILKTNTSSNLHRIQASANGLDKSCVWSSTFTIWSSIPSLAYKRLYYNKIYQISGKNTYYIEFMFMIFMYYLIWIVKCSYIIRVCLFCFMFSYNNEIIITISDWDQYLGFEKIRQTNILLLNYYIISFMPIYIFLNIR